MWFDDDMTPQAIILKLLDSTFPISERMNMQKAK